MAESIIFQCDMCGQKSEEEPAELPRRERCRVELVFRGQRFVLAPPAASEGVPASLPWGALPLPPGIIAGAAPWPPLWGLPGAPPEVAVAAPTAAPAPEEDERVVYTLCDACMKRTCAFFDLKAETFEEYSARAAREADLARRISAPLPSSGGMQGKMTSMFPTREREPGHGPGPGGLVDQFPTPGAGPEPAPASAAPVSVHSVGSAAAGPESGASEDKQAPPAAQA
ncbi:MAG TPA: hypothetical protein VMI75_03945 [Polyangiaceae bacterium]|nr:hypothetical protein [Polyangiaceae bacterium]